MTATTTIVPSVTPSSGRSSHAIRTTIATMVRAAVTPFTTDRVATSRSSTVSEVTRDIRSPGRLRSMADMRSRSIRPTRWSRADRTTNSAVLPRMYSATAPSTADTTRSTLNASRISAMGRPAPSRDTSSPATSGCASAARLPARARTPAPVIAFRCGRAYPPSVRQVALDVALELTLIGSPLSSPRAPVRSILWQTHRDISR